MRCAYCDTPETHSPLAACRVYGGALGEKGASIAEYPNPLSGVQLSETLSRHYSRYMDFSLTGGEPLEQVDFLAAWLPGFRAEDPRRRILLETAGVHSRALARLIPWIDRVSMDLKPKSATGMEKEFWTQHAAFLDVLRAHPPCQAYIKIPMGQETLREEGARVLEWMRRFPDFDYFLQPLSPLRPEDLRAVFEFTVEARGAGFSARCLPQLHPLLGIK